MALIKCPECRKEVSSMAITCPYCGFPIKESLNEKTLNEEHDGITPEVLKETEVSANVPENIKNQGNEKKSFLSKLLVWAGIIVAICIVIGFFIGVIPKLKGESFLDAIEIILKYIGYTIGGTLFLGATIVYITNWKKIEQSAFVKGFIVFCTISGVITCVELLISFFKG